MSGAMNAVASRLNARAAALRRLFGLNGLGVLGLLVAQALDGVELGGPSGRDGAENYADYRRHDDGDNGGQTGDRDAVLGKEANGVRDGEADDDAGEASDEGDEDCLGQKLKTDFAVGGADGLADADLADAGGHGSQHDVHD